MKSVTAWWLSLLLGWALVSPLVQAEPRQALLELADMLAHAISTNNYSDIDKRFDREGFADTMIEKMQIPAGDARDVHKHLLANINLGTILGNGLGGFDHSTLGVKVIGIVRDKNQLLPVVRIRFPEGGTNYYELRVTKIKNQYYIRDIFIRANSQYVSETIGQTITIMSGLPSGWVAALAYRDGSRDTVVERINAAVAARKAGDFQAAYDSLQELPQSVKEEDVVNLMIVMISAHLGDEIYRHELSVFAERHGDNPRYNFMLIDHYYFMGQYDKALAATEKMLKRYPGDAAMIQMKAVIYLEQQEHQKANDALRLAQQSEPDFEELYWTGVTVGLRNNDYVSVVYWLEQYEKQFRMQFDSTNFENQEHYEGFLKSGAYLHWMIHKSA